MGNLRINFCHFLAKLGDGGIACAASAVHLAWCEAGYAGSEAAELVPP